MNNFDFESLVTNDNFEGFALPARWHDILGNLFPDSWFEGMRSNFGETLSDDMIIESVHQASVFFNMEDPMAVQEDYAIGVYNQLPFTPIDDIVVFNREQFEMMGITEKDGLDLVMTHEGAHRALQGIEHGFNDHQEELCCDFMAGVRAGLNNMDFSQMEASLVDTTASDSHPGGADRVIAINKGVEYAQEYKDDHGYAPSFNECLIAFKEEYQISQNEMGDVSEHQINLRDDSSTSVFSAYGDSGETAGGAAFVDNNVDESNISFKGYTKDEIDRKIAKAEKEQRYHESMVRHHTSMAKHGLSNADTKSHLHEAEIHQSRANDWKAECQKWKWTKPDPE